MKKITFLVLVFALFGVCLLSKNDVYAKSKADKLYDKFLKKDSCIYYTKLNIDRKGCKELLTLEKNTMGVKVYTIKNNKVKYLGEIWNKYSPEVIAYNKYGFLAFDGPGGEGYLTYTIKKGKLKMVRSIFREEMIPPAYYVNDKVCTKSKYKKYKKKYFSNIKYKKMKKNKLNIKPKAKVDISNISVTKKDGYWKASGNVSVVGFSNGKIALSYDNLACGSEGYYEGPTVGYDKGIKAFIVSKNCECDIFTIGVNSGTEIVSVNKLVNSVADYVNRSNLLFEVKNGEIIRMCIYVYG